MFNSDKFLEMIFEKIGIDQHQKRFYTSFILHISPFPTLDGILALDRSLKTEKNSYFLMCENEKLIEFSKQYIALIDGIDETKTELSIVPIDNSDIKNVNYQYQLTRKINKDGKIQLELVMKTDSKDAPLSIYNQESCKFMNEENMSFPEYIDPDSTISINKEFPITKNILTAMFNEIKEKEKTKKLHF